MKADFTVTVWHYTNDEDLPKRQVFYNVCVDKKAQISKNGIKQKGFYQGDSANVRIFTEKEIRVVPGDYLYIGKSHDAVPDAESCMKIIEVKDNRRGINMHWRILCGG